MTLIELINLFTKPSEVRFTIYNGADDKDVVKNTTLSELKEDRQNSRYLNSEVTSIDWPIGELTINVWENTKVDFTALHWTKPNCEFIYSNHIEEADNKTVKLPFRKRRIPLDVLNTGKLFYGYAYFTTQQAAVEYVNKHSRS